MVSWNSLTRLGGSSCYITTYSSVFLYYEKLNIRWFNCFSYLVFQGQILPSIDLEESYGNIEKHGPSLPLWVKGAAKLLSSGEENQDWLALAKLMGEYWVKSPNQRSNCRVQGHYCFDCQCKVQEWYAIELMNMSS